MTMNYPLISWLAQFSRTPSVAALFAIITGGLSGYIGGHLGNHRASTEVPIEGVGRIELLILPATARSWRNIREFVLEMTGVDDYGRAFVNNYLVINREDPAALIPGAPPQVQEQVRLRTVDRRANLQSKLDIKPFLKKGRNFIVFEVENSRGPCSLGINSIVNGIPLRSFPRSLPDDFDVEDDAVNVALLKAFKDFELPVNEDALCSRRIFEIILD